MRTKPVRTIEILKGKFTLLFIIFLLYGGAYTIPVYAVEVTQDNEPEYVEWMKEFVSLRASNKDSALPLMKIKDYYSSLSVKAKEKINRKMIDMVSDYIRGGLTTETMAMIDLYDFLADKKDAKRPDLYFIRGNIYAERQDTVMLKETIAQIESCYGKQEYLDKLNDYLLQIRKFVPADQGLDGYWVSDVLISDAFGGYGWDLPKYIINTTSNNSVTKMTIMVESPFITGVCITTKSLLVDKIPQTSQYLFPFTKDSLYVSWSSEKLKSYDANLVGGIRQITGITSATISGELAQRNKYSTGDALAGSMLTGIAEVGLNSLFDVIFMPSKKLYVLEGRFKKVNDYILEGNLKYTHSKIKAGEEANARFNTETEKITLLKWTPESGVIFMSFYGWPITPYEHSNIPVEKQKKKIEKAKKKGKEVDEKILPYWKDLANDTSTEYGRAYQERKKSKDKKEFIKQWNRNQIEKLREYNIEHGK